jgi:DHA2 family multidrug resistance protein
VTNDSVPAAPRQVSPWLVSISVMAGTFMVILDSTVVNVSLPHIAGSLSATVEESTWSLTSYLAANAVILPITGWLANFFGRKRLLLFSLVGFTAASLVCGLALNLAMMIVFRVVQGLCGGLMQPLSQAVMLEAFPPQERGKAMAFWGLGIVVAPILGPVLGGWLTTNWSWRWIFYINLPVGVVAVILTSLFIFDPPYIRRGSARIDYWGIGLLTVGIGALQIALDRGQEKDWLSSHAITWLLVTATICLLVLVARELTVSDPVVNLKVLANRTYATGLALITLVGVVLYGSLVLIPIMLQTLMGYPPVEAGLAMAPRGLGSFLSMPLIGILTTRRDPRKLLGTGFALAAFTLFWLSWLNTEVGYWELFWPQFVQGIALSLLFVPLTTITMDPIPVHEMGNATSLYNLMRNLGGSVGIALIQTFVVRQRQLHTSRLGEHVTLYDPGTRLMLERLQAAFIEAGADAVTALDRATAAIWGMVQKQAAILSYLDAFHVLGLVVVVIAPLAILMRRPRQAGRGAPAGDS